MKFLVILFALVINHYWTRERDILNDGWFVRYQSALGERIKDLPAELAQRRWLYPVLILVLPPLLLGLVLLVIEGVSFGLITFLIHVGVLLALFDRVNVNSITARYLELWRAGNFEGAFLMLQERWHQLSLDNCTDRTTLHDDFCRFLISSYFERLFAVVFWYLLLGPVGALFYHLGFLYRNRVWEHSDTEEGALVLRLVYLLEWLPARLLALTFSLAGDFVAAFGRLREIVMDLDRSAISVVHACALAALGSAQRVVLVRNVSDLDAPDLDSSKPGATNAGDTVTTVLIDTESTESDEVFPVRAAQQTEDLLALLYRSQVIWVSVLALLALYGVGN